MLNINPIQVEDGKITETINLYAPINGSVTKINVSNGMYVSPETAILELVNTEHIHLELSVFEKDILNIKKDQHIRFKIPEASSKTFDAEVHLVGTTIDPVNRIVPVHGHILNESETNFIVGMFVNAEIIMSTTKKLALPNEAIIEADNKHFALVLHEQTNTEYHFEKVEVKIDEQTETYTAILNNSTLQDKTILTKGGFMLLNEGGGGHSH